MQDPGAGLIFGLLAILTFCIMMKWRIVKQPYLISTMIPVVMFGAYYFFVAFIHVDSGIRLTWMRGCVVVFAVVGILDVLGWMNWHKIIGRKK